MLNIVVRLLAFAALAVAMWAGVSWAPHPQLPSHADATQFPLVALMVFESSRGVGPWQSVFSMVAFALTAATMLLAAALAAWLAWRGTNRPALRDLTAALALGSMAVGWFWFLRPWSAPTFASALSALDYLFVLAWFIAGWAMQTAR